MSAGKETVSFTSEDKHGESIDIVVKRPKSPQLIASKSASNKAFRAAADSDAMSRSEIDEFMRKRGMWDDEKEQQLQDLNTKIDEGVRQLARGGKTADGKKFSKEDAKNLALDIRSWRFEQLLLLVKRNELDEFSIQSQAENAKFDALVSLCTYDSEGELVFEDIEDYRSRAEEPFAIEAATKLGELFNGMDPDFEKNKPENQFLLKHNMVNEDLRLIDGEGNLVARDGRRINEEGHYLNDDNEIVDVDGNRINEDGTPYEEFTPFEEDVVEEKPKAKPKGRPKKVAEQE